MHDQYPISRSGVTEVCEDYDVNCRNWVISDRSLCDSIDYISKTCRKSCRRCSHKIEERFDASLVPDSLKPLAWLIGIWRSEHGGKAIFPTIPKFTYGEQVEISIANNHMSALKALNYTAFAWSMNGFDELHSEYGYITLQPGTNYASLTTVMNNGFVTIEQGFVKGNQVVYRLHDIGRISFSRDLPVHDVVIIISLSFQVVREWTLLSDSILQARLEMETLTHGMQEHTFIRYNKIYP
ncbi:unnamed protein product [Anisakis simplex]|uniref:ShKT domain-containing protein n=1 Tax=Anisakis simplex TaxID=6269 RepID=A0A0M3JT36_ANISI|nr:unnamed protein product [Anisakis simplex]